MEGVRSKLLVPFTGAYYIIVMSKGVRKTNVYYNQIFLNIEELYDEQNKNPRILIPFSLRPKILVLNLSR